MRPDNVAVIPLPPSLLILDSGGPFLKQQTILGLALHAHRIHLPDTIAAELFYLDYGLENLKVEK